MKDNVTTAEFLVIANIRDRKIQGSICPMLKVFKDLKSATEFYDKIKLLDDHRLDSIYLIEGTLWRTKVFSGVGIVLRDEDFDKEEVAS